ncbi:related to phospholipid-translocating ATPase [Cephalotrichum gorgonifer]|uniref:Related to phospholipid-translocating ATPase n=1 Tax=Cephalotrichum gorgonifer TaxID=2041049 RepID=A0AAE8SUA2_9PEZI|nr:related to phospholipid-translocating ATPase [Cephalotrichum gorgonifer]
MSDLTNSTVPPGWQPGFDTCHSVSPLCPVELTVYGDYFSLGGSAFYVAAHSALLVAQIYLGWRARTWSFAGYLGVATAFEIAGYAGRVVMSDNPWSYASFVIQLLFLILGPTLVAASISVTFKHLVIWHGPEWSFIRPVLYPWVFVGPDIFSIVIQAAGGGVSASATGGEGPADQGLLDVGDGLLLAGVVFQLANMIFCGGLMVVYLWRRHHGLKLRATQGGVSGSSTPTAVPTKPVTPEDKKVQTFIYAITAAYIAVIIRCVYRIPEQQKGWGNDLMQNETLFLILDGAMVLIAVILLTVFHPNYFFPFLSNNKEKKFSAGPPPGTSGLDVEGYEMRTSSTPDQREAAP